MRRALAGSGSILVVFSLGLVSISHADDDDEKAPPRKGSPEKKGGTKTDDSREVDEDKVAPEARLCYELARGEAIHGIAVEPYIDLLTEGDVEGWNKRRKKDKGKVLDLGGRTWEPKKRDELALKLEGLDFSGADFSAVLFMPGTSFRGSDLTGAVFKGACLDGVSFSSIRSFEAREKKQVRSTCLDDADFRGAIWSWCSALERTAKRCRDEPAKPPTREERQRALLERQRRYASSFNRMDDPFAFVDLETAKFDADSPRGPSPDDDNDSRRDRQKSVLARLIKGAAAENVGRAIERIAGRRTTARAKECPNPLAQEPALADAIAAADTSIAGVATWKAVHLVDPAASDDGVAVVGGKDVLFVIDDERSLRGVTLVISEGPIYAWGRAYLPTTFSAHPIVLKDQATVGGVLHAHPVFALSDPVRDPRRRNDATSGTFCSEVVTEVTKVENLSAADVDKKKLKDLSLKEYAHSVGDDLERQPRLYDPTDGQDGRDAETLRKGIRKAIEAQAGKAALAGMKCYDVGAYKFPGPGNPTYFHVLSKDPKAILVITKDFTGTGSIYSEGPIVIESGDQPLHQRCVSKSWIVVEGQKRRVPQLLSLGERIDVDPADAGEDDKKTKGEK